MSIAEGLVAELRQEHFLTRRLLERVPEDRIDWRPHAKSMTLGRLAGHIADVQGLGRAIFGGHELDLAAARPPGSSSGGSEAVAALDRHHADLLQLATGADDDFMLAPWTLRRGERVVFTLPRATAFRTMVVHHTIHHRGQLTVYLRLLDVALPSIYGPTADEGFA
jgi:uncharacterized damage-inducible protein DinB